jgi:hydroxymethylglutaryl-CoA lyase
MPELARMQELCFAQGKKLVVYLSMGFGNPYGDPYSPALVVDFAGRVAGMGVRIIAPSDTVGSSTAETTQALFGQLIPAFPDIEFGAHLHSVLAEAEAKIEAAYRAGCRRFDGAVRGFGGCPLATDRLTGNIPTESILTVFEKQQIRLDLNVSAFGRAWEMAAEVFAQA